MKKIQSDKPFASETIVTRGKEYLLTDKGERTNEDGDMVYFATVTEITSTIKEAKLQSLTVTVNDKVFYANSESRIDINDEIDNMIENNLTTTQWKTKNGQMEVTLDELKQAKVLAKQKKAEIIGIV